LVAALLVTHGLHPVPLQQRVERAIASVRPYMRSHAGDVEIVSVDEDVVQVRLQGTCDGCAASQATLKDAIERAVFAACPEVLEVRAVQTQAATIDLLPVVL
jgi:Fe-S cluster biogenesis protein NfuA